MTALKQLFSCADIPDKRTLIHSHERHRHGGQTSPVVPQIPTSKQPHTHRCQLAARTSQSLHADTSPSLVHAYDLPLTARTAVTLVFSRACTLRGIPASKLASPCPNWWDLRHWVKQYSIFGAFTWSIPKKRLHAYLSGKVRENLLDCDNQLHTKLWLIRNTMTQLPLQQKTDSLGTQNVLNFAVFSTHTHTHTHTGSFLLDLTRPSMVPPPLYCSFYVLSPLHSIRSF